MATKNRISPSLIVLLSVFVFVVYSSFDRHKWKSEEIIQYDVYSYYSYLPAVFIYDDLSFGFIDKLPEKIRGMVWIEHTRSGMKYQKMTMGLAFMWTPFFLIAKQYNHLKDINDSGFGKSYQHSIALAALFYLLIGLIYLRKTLRAYFNEIITSFLLLTVVLGTNLFYYTVTNSGMSHVYSFSLIAVFLFYSIKWDENYKKTKYAITLAFIGGLIVLIRPLNILILLFPVFYDWDLKKSQVKFLWLLKQYYLLPLLIICFCLPLTPQLFYWKYVSGNFLFYSYEDEHFYFFNPHVWDGLFSFRKGFFLYTPFMFLLIPGIVISIKQKKPFGWVTTVITFLFVYISFSWWCWWYGGSFGARTMIDFYPLFCILIGVFATWVFKKNLPFKASFIFLLLLFVCLNMFQTKQYESNLLHYDSMSKELYFKIWGNTNRPENYNHLLKSPDYKKASSGGE